MGVPVAQKSGRENRPIWRSKYFKSDLLREQLLHTTTTKWREHACDVTMINDECDITAMNNERDITTIDDEGDVTMINDECDITMIRNECVITHPEHMPSACGWHLQSSAGISHSSRHAHRSNKLDTHIYSQIWNTECISVTSPLQTYAIGAWWNLRYSAFNSYWSWYRVA